MPLYPNSLIPVSFYNSELAKTYIFILTFATSTLKRLNELQHQHKQAILVEEFISGKEIVTCFLGNQNTLNCMEIVEVFNEDDDNYLTTNFTS